MKKIISMFLLIFSLLGLFGCFINKENPYPYIGKYKELYTTAIYSIPNSIGFMHHGEGAYNADIYIWGKDDYGRIIYSYCEDYGNRIFALVISQTYDESKVYFYPDKNYRLTFIDSEYSYEGIDENHLKNKTQDFYLSVGESLKKDNDWNKPIDYKKCVSHQITDHKIIEENAFRFNEHQANEILLEYSKTIECLNPEYRPHRYNSVLQTDANGKVLHEIFGLHRNFDNKDNTLYINLWIITDKSGNYDKEKGILVMLSKKSDEYDTDYIYDSYVVEDFKNNNDWTYQYCE